MHLTESTTHRLRRRPGIRRLGCALALTLVSAAHGADLPVVKLFTTGGTIQSRALYRNQLSEYGDGPRVKPAELIADVPEASTIAKIEPVEISNIGSGGINTEILLKLAKGLNAELAKPGVTGAVVTHGTGTLEETAYFLQLTVKSKKPVVVIGAMRPWSAISRDGLFNFYNAVRTAVTPEASGKGVLVLLNDTIHSARFVTKNNTYRVETFVAREIGPIGFADSDRIVFYRTPLCRHTAESEFDISSLDSLPQVDVLYGYQEASAAGVDALVADGAKGLIFADSSPEYRKAILKAQGAGVVIVQSDRKGSGRVLVSASTAARGVISSDNLNPQKARILLRLALTKTTQPKEIQRMFNEY